MVLLRRVIGDALRARRQGQHRTLREVSTAANVSLGYLSEIERGQKEASSELLAAICEALGARLSELLGEVSSTLQLAEGMEGVLVPVEPSPVPAQEAKQSSGAMRAAASAPAGETAPVRQVATDGKVSVSVHQETPLKATLRATRKRDRGVVYAA
ncbi:helix-turn-helix domain-containing protein [Symbioplanes lichenis]|uniref:helix-turn-helix domain-containing protein n=1 Tax=Symbioplanes lichenis TaxID=1629072 RepID=UPI00273A2A77|nr:helix-turn-helix transcriptional regulator [Actinoplanes lichenis]